MWWGCTETCCVIIVWELLDQNIMQGDLTYQMSKLTPMRRCKYFCFCVLPQAEHRALFHSSSIHVLTWPFKQTTKNRSVFLAFKFVPIKYISTHSSPHYVKFIPPSLDMFFWQGLFSEHSAVSLTCAAALFWKGTATATVSRVIYLATVIMMIKTKSFFQAAFRFYCSCCFVHKCDWIKKIN